MARWRILIFLVCALFIPQEKTMGAPPPMEIAKAVTFIFLADGAGNLQLHPQTGGPFANGTGFFVFVENTDGPGGYGYLVTAKHVLQDENGKFYSRVYVRVNDKNSGSEFGWLDLTVSGDKQNVFAHTDPTVDIAVIPMLPDQNKFDYLAIPTALIKSKEDFKKSTIMPGSDVFFAGLFTPHVGDKRNVPIFRFGRVAMLTDDRIRWQEAGKQPQMVELYLLETMSFGGNSGAPVFFSQGMDRQPGSIILGAPEITLAGVMRGNFNEAHPGELIQIPNASVAVVRQNIGIAAVTPAYLLREILYSERLKKLRSDNPIKVPAELKPAEEGPPALTK
jgi:hypothetical protein